MTTAQTIASDLAAEAAMTRRLIERIPANLLDFSPGAGLHTVGWNASHLVETAGWTVGIINDPGLDLAALDAEQQAAPATDIAGLLERFDENVKQSLAALATATDERLAEPWTMRMGDQELFTMQKGPCLRKWVLVHTGHHRGILSATLRLAGVKIGSIYEE